MARHLPQVENLIRSLPEELDGWLSSWQVENLIRSLPEELDSWLSSRD